MKRAILLGLVVLAAGAVAASCGGAVDSTLLGDGGGSDSAGNGDGGAKDGAADAPVADSGTACAALLAQIDAERKALRACCPPCKSIQCNAVADDVCCPFTTNGSQDLKPFEALVGQYKIQCKPICPGAPCLPVPSGICDPSGGDPSLGVCR